VLRMYCDLIMNVLIVRGASGFCCWSADATKTTMHASSHVIVVVLSSSVRWCHSSGTICIRGSVTILAVTANHRFSAVEYVRAVLTLVECLYRYLTVLRLAVRYVIVPWLFVVPKKGTRRRLARLRRDVLV
jgi:hypothetical protein